MEQLQSLHWAVRLKESSIDVVSLADHFISDHLLGLDDVHSWLFVLDLSELFRFSSQEFELFFKLNGGWESENDVKHSFVAELRFSEGLEES